MKLFIFLLQKGAADDMYINAMESRNDNNSTIEIIGMIVVAILFLYFMSYMIDGKNKS